MKYTLLIIATLFILQPAPAKAAELEKHTMKHGVLTREYFVYDPRKRETKTGKRPLIVVLHGGGGLAEKFDGMTGREASFNALADREDLLIVYPQGYKKNWNDGREVSQVDAMSLDLDDVGFITAIIDKMIGEYNVDAKKVYATGPSNGGHMSNRLACDIADKVAAVGIVIANMPVKYKDKCKPSSPVSVLIMNGTEDPLVPFNGGFVRITKKGKDRGEDISTAATFDFWLKQAGNSGGGESVKPVQLEDADTGDKTRVTRQDYTGKDAEVALYTVEGGGHTWPGGRQYLFEFIVGRTSRDINATEVIWDFFKSNPKR